MQSSRRKIRSLSVVFISSALLPPMISARPQGAVPVLGEAAALAAQRIEERMRGAGIRLTPEDVKAIRVSEGQRAEIKNMYTDLSKYQAAYQKDGNKMRLEQIARQKQELRIIQNMLPNEFSNSAFMPSYMASVRMFMERSGKAQEWMNRTRSQENVYKSEHPEAVSGGGAVVKNGSGSAVGKGGGATAGGGAVSGQPGRNLEVYIIGKSGDCEFYINDQKVEYARQSFALNGQSSFTVRALAIGARRKQSREFIANVPDHITPLEHDDYSLGYETSAGGSNASTHWKVDQESYTWSGARISNSNAQFAVKSSGKNSAVKDDALEFRYQGAFTGMASVQGSVKWKAISKRGGGTREMTADDSAKGAIEFSVSPK